MSTQMGYGQFYEILEDMNFPSSDDGSSDDDQPIKASKQQVVSQQLLSGDDNQRTRIVNHFFKTMEQINLSQVSE